MNLFLPSATAGAPGSVAPITSKSPADMCARYQVDGSLVPRCGSLASSGLPDEDIEPSNNQLFEPSPSWSFAWRKSRTAGTPCDKACVKSATTELSTTEGKLLSTTE